ncbi:MAG: glycosyltransferase family 4 protein [Verrucomicrobia bacterium]|nr:glycosyltransferase family 4 protein [Verrucomicrobiota bacterium]
MKILFDHSHPFLLAHGGFQIQIEQTKAALEAAGVEVEFLRWWDDRQRGDLIHFWSAAGTGYLQAARARQLPVVMTTLFTETCNRSDAQLRRQARLTRLVLGLPFGEGVKQQLAWRAYNLCTHNVVGLEAERRVLEWVYRVPPANISVVPLGLSETYLRAGAGDRREPHLICTGTITERKNCVELATLARAAQVPILFVGKPYHAADPYWRRFEKLVDGRFVKLHPHVGTEAEMIALLRAARGFVLMSRYENWCLSAHEAAACGLPLLVPDQKWSRERFGPAAHYLEPPGSAGNTEILRRFYEAAPSLPPPAVKLHSWGDAARELKAIYERRLAR